MAAHAHEQLRELGGRHLYPWFEQHEEVLVRGLADNLALDVSRRAVYHVLGAPSIASLTAACLTTDRSIDIARLERLVKDVGGARQLLLFQVAAELYGGKTACRSASCSPSLTVRTSIACFRRSPCNRRRFTNPESPRDLWIRAAKPED